MNIPKKLLFVVPVVALLAAPVMFESSFAHAGARCDSHGFGGHGRGGMGMKWFKHVADDLDLSKEQKREVKKIVKSQRKANKSLYKEVKQSRLAMVKLDPTAANYSSALAELTKTHSELVKKKMLVMGETWLQVVAVLTPDQQVALKEMQADIADWTE